MLIRYGAVNLTYMSNIMVHRPLITARQCYFHISVAIQINLLQSFVDLTYIYIYLRIRQKSNITSRKKHIDIKRHIGYFKLSWKFNIDVEFGLRDVTACILRDRYGFHPQNNFYTANKCTEP